MINYKEIEIKWQKAWSDSKVFEVEPNEKPGLLVTAAFPYVDMPQHIGHIRTYGTADLYSRYMRMTGQNVLFPMAFHKTGTPILAIAKRVASGEPEIIKDLKMFGVSNESVIKKMSDPNYVADYFVEVTQKSMMATGYGIDWRRTFTSTDPLYSKMVEWQFMKLKEKGYLTQGSHFVGWCPNEKNAVGQHDTKHDIQPELDELIVIKFKDANSDAYFPCATYRPETLYGVTNIFVSELKYVLAKINDKHYYLSKEAAGLLSHQLEISIERELDGSELLSKKAVNPLTDEVVPVLPGYFVKSDFGTGVVMSVPAHAPFDYVALERLRTKGYNIPDYKSCVSSDGIDASKLPALAYLELMEGTPESDDKLVEQATKELYRYEEKHGRMGTGKYVNKPVSEARPLIAKDLTESKNAFNIHIISNEEPVYCRCGARVVAKLITGQWFIDYGNSEWKALAREHAKKIKFYPEVLKKSFYATIEWINLRAAERAQGLGTKFPFNPQHIIESLSDSTMYMMFYTFSHILKSKKIQPEQLNPEFFDYVIADLSSASQVAKITHIEENIIKECKEQLEYWYGYTSRHSAPDLITNHLVMYLFNHIALAPQKLWPKQIVVNGMVDYEGEKMSKSLGNIIPALDGIEKYGADPLRFMEIVSGDLSTDTEFSTTIYNSLALKNQTLYNMVLETKSMQSEALTHIDYWLYSKLNKKIQNATKYMENLELRDAYIDIYYDSITELKWYAARGGRNALVAKDFLDKVVLMLAPAMPHFAEELWHMLGNNTLVAKERWPAVELSLINQDIEATEEIISSTAEDINTTKELTSKMSSNSGKRLTSITIIIPEQWKTKAYNLLAEKRSIGKVMNDELLQSIEKAKLSAFLSQFSKKLQTLSKVQELNEGSLVDAFKQASEYLGRRFNTEIIIESEFSSKSSRALRAMPNKPSIDIRWE